MSFSSARPELRSSGFTLVELLVVIAIVVTLMALLLPAVQSARESARATDCKNRMKQLALAAHHHHESLGYFPAARYISRPGDSEDCGKGTPTWLVRVLPYLEESAFDDAWDLSRPWHRHEEQVRTHAPEVFLCPSRRHGGETIGASQIITTRTTNEPVQEIAPCGCSYSTTVEVETENLVNVLGALSDYAGNHGDLSPGSIGAATDFYYGGNGSGVIISVRPKCATGKATGPRDRVRLASVTDGTTSTLLFGEKYIPADGLTKLPYDAPAYDGSNLSASVRLAGPGLRLAVGRVDLLASVFSFGSWHPNTVHFAMVDGSVQRLSTETDTQVLGLLANRLDAHVVELEN